MIVCAVFMFFTAIMALILRFIMVWDNRRLNQKYGKPAGGSKNLDKDDIAAENYGPNFRYAL